MKVTKAEIVISAVSEKHYPKLDLPELALAGRSNVGKSSFINRMIGRKNLVRTSSKPGKTRTLNFYNINDLFVLVDVPGYGYAKVSKQERDKWGHMMEEYFEMREALSVVVLIVDMRHTPSKEDISMYHYVKYHELPVIVIATKADKVKKGARSKQINVIRTALDADQNDPIVPFSSETGEGKSLAWRYFEEHL